MADRIIALRGCRESDPACRPSDATRCANFISKVSEARPSGRATIVSWYDQRRATRELPSLTVRLLTPASSELANLPTSISILNTTQTNQRTSGEVHFAGLEVRTCLERFLHF